MQTGCWLNTQCKLLLQQGQCRQTRRTMVRLQQQMRQNPQQQVWQNPQQQMRQNLQQQMRQNPQQQMQQNPQQQGQERQAGQLQGVIAATWVLEHQAVAAGKQPGAQVELQ